MSVGQPYFNNQEFVNRLKAKDKSAFEQLYDTYSGAIFSVLLTILKDRETAEDILQESFFKVWKNIESYDLGKGTIYTWILNISRNTALDQLRKISVRPSIKGDETLVEEIQVKGINTNTIGIEKSFKYLTAEQTQVIKAVYYNGLTHQEAAEALSIPLGTVKTRVKNALSTLKNVFKN